MADYAIAGTSVVSGDYNITSGALATLSAEFQAAQLVIDTAAVTAAKGSIAEGTTILGVAGLARSGSVIGKGIANYVSYVCLDSTGAPVTGDVANHHLYWDKGVDGARAAVTNTPEEVSAANAPGRYRVLLTATERTCEVGVLDGYSDTSGVVIVPHSTAIQDTTVGPTLNLSRTTVGESPEVNITQYQYAQFGAVSITAETAQTGDSHAFLVYDPRDPTTVSWSLTTAGGEISVGGSDGKTVTLIDTDAHMGTAGTFAYILRNTTDDTTVCVGALTIVAAPNVPVTP
jgi:hypothetical protein